MIGALTRMSGQGLDEDNYWSKVGLVIQYALAQLDADKQPN